MLPIEDRAVRMAQMDTEGHDIGEAIKTLQEAIAVNTINLGYPSDWGTSAYTSTGINKIKSAKVSDIIICDGPGGSNYYINKGVVMAIRVYTGSPYNSLTLVTLEDGNIVLRVINSDNGDILTFVRYPTSSGTKLYEHRVKFYAGQDSDHELYLDVDVIIQSTESTPFTTGNIYDKLRHKFLHGHYDGDLTYFTVPDSEEFIGISVAQTVHGNLYISSYAPDFYLDHFSDTVTPL